MIYCSAVVSLVTKDKWYFLLLLYRLRMLFPLFSTLFGRVRIILSPKALLDIWVYRVRLFVFVGNNSVSWILVTKEIVSSCHSLARLYKMYDAHKVLLRDFNIYVKYHSANDVHIKEVLDRWIFLITMYSHHTVHGVG